MPSKKGKGWNEAECNDLLVRYDSGETYNQIARALNRSYASVQSKIWKLNKDRNWLLQATDEAVNDETVNGKEEVDTDIDDIDTENVNIDRIARNKRKKSNKTSKRKRREIAMDSSNDELITPRKKHRTNRPISSLTFFCDQNEPKPKKRKLNNCTNNNMCINNDNVMDEIDVNVMNDHTIITFNNKTINNNTVNKNININNDDITNNVDIPLNVNDNMDDIDNDNNNKNDKDMKDWSVDQVIEWMDNISTSLTELIKREFKEQEIDGKTLEIMGKDDLLQLGIKKLYDRIVIIQQRDKLLNKS